jgi:SAM-dependent methyltransferase
MKTRESGMPEEAVWETFFRPEEALDRLQLKAGVGDVVEFGCGYGTFTLPAARRSLGTVFALDIEPEMIASTVGRAEREGVTNIVAVERDFVASGTGLPPELTEYAMLFNILHAEEPLVLLAEAWRILGSGGLLGIMHWNYDGATPRGPTMDIRPRPAQCRDWAIAAGFELLPTGIVALPPYHYGLVVRKPPQSGHNLNNRAQPSLFQSPPEKDNKGVPFARL